MSLSRLAETLIGSEIIKLAAEVNEQIRQGESVYNFTIGDFDPSIFPIPSRFEELIHQSYKAGYTNYPAAEGIPELREAVSAFISNYQHLEYSKDEILISGGGRPLIYAAYRTIVDQGDKVVYAVPSWNNNHYTHFVNGRHVLIETTPEDDFMPTAESLKEVIDGAVLLALCSPLNPTGTAISRKNLYEICELVVEENKYRTEGKKLHILFDQMYWMLTYGDTVHYNPVELFPELRDVTIFVDGMSKSFAATGVRIGWTMAPKNIIGKMKAIISHIGAWSPMPEQKAAAIYLKEFDAIDEFMNSYKSKLYERLSLLDKGFKKLAEKFKGVEVIDPMAAIYLTLKFDLVGKKLNNGTILKSQEDVTAFLLKHAGLAIVPFFAFGSSKDSPWYRLSVGTCKTEEIPQMFTRLESALNLLS